jgi:hypothetical protein
MVGVQTARIVDLGGNPSHTDVRIFPLNNPQVKLEKSFLNLLYLTLAKPGNKQPA